MTMPQRAQCLTVGGVARFPLAADLPGCVHAVRQQAEDACRDQALATAGRADQAQALAMTDTERNSMEHELPIVADG